MTPTLVASAGFAAVMLHLLLRALKSGQVVDLLGKLGLPAIPKNALPWLSIGLGLLGGLADALAQGMGWQDAMQAVFMGLFAGTGAIALHETSSQFEKVPAVKLDLDKIEPPKE